MIPHRIMSALCCGALLALAAAGPAFAQDVGGNVGSFIHMAPNQLIVLRAGMAPVRGRKIAYWREKAFTARVSPPPTVPPHPGAGGGEVYADPTPPTDLSPGPLDDLTLTLETAGLEPLPPQGASEAEVEAWVDRFIDASAQVPAKEASHG